MSVQFGRWNFDGQPHAAAYSEKVKGALAAYSADSIQEYCAGGVKILYGAFYTTKEARREKQPYISPSGAVITWDGRLDNRSELLSELRCISGNSATDVEIVAAAYDRFGIKCFGKLIGDWALSIWEPNKRSLLLTKDVIGTRHLYYEMHGEQITWSTLLDPLVRFAGRTFDLDMEYVAGWFSSMYPAVHLTPCIGICSVPPSSYVLLQPGKCSVTRYWDFDPEKRIRFRTDAEYEEHFRAVFAKAVQRCLRSESPVLAELSGGRDSSSIVCMADTIMAKGHPDCPRLDTISNYDDSEPNWNERPYFTKVEEKRGRTGWHVNMNQEHGERSEPGPSAALSEERFGAYPGYDGRTSPQMKACLLSQGNRVVLSGTGGDEVMGGVPTPSLELQDLLARGQFRTLARQLKAWALEKRRPWFHLFWEAARDFLPVSLVGVPKFMKPAPWLRPAFVRRHKRALTGYPARTKLFGPLPTFQGNVGAIDYLRRQLTRAALPFDPPFEKRYPFLDRDLLEFMFAIPREQLVRPTQRRSLMRRALVGIVPDEILNRKTKAYVARAPLVQISREWSTLAEMTQHMISSALGIVDAERFSDILQKARHGEDEVPTLAVTSTLMIEGWLKHLRGLGIMNLGMIRQAEFAMTASAES